MTARCQSDPTSMSKLWYYADPSSSGHIGPLPPERLQSILANLPHASDAFVWCEGMPEWKRVGEIPALRAPLTAPPPLPKAFENEQMPTWRVRWWWLVFALGAPVISSRDGRRMMGWTSGQRGRTAEAPFVADSSASPASPSRRFRGRRVSYACLRGECPS